jgi:hypothetical protein
MRGDVSNENQPSPRPSPLSSRRLIRLWRKKGEGDKEDTPQLAAGYLLVIAFLKEDSMWRVVD